MIVRRCYSCSSEVNVPMKCGRCKAVYYCNSECQKRDWPTHKTICNDLLKTPIGKEGKKTVYSFVDELMGTALTTQLSALKNYAINHGLGKGMNAFVVNECVDGFGHAVKQHMGLEQSISVYHLYTEWITSTALPREYTIDKLNIAVGRDVDGTGAPSISLMDNPMPSIIAEMIAMTLLGSHSVIETLFSSKATLSNPWILMVPSRGKLYLLNMTQRGKMTITPCGSIPLPGSLI